MFIKCIWKIGYSRKNEGFLRTLHLRNTPPFFFLNKMGILRIFACEATPFLALLAVRRAGGPRLGRLDQWENDKNGWVP